MIKHFVSGELRVRSDLGTWIVVTALGDDADEINAYLAENDGEGVIGERDGVIFVGSCNDMGAKLK